MVKFSIIIPVYNIEKYIKKCIESVLSQSFQNYEVIVVNDGSTDGSAQVIDECCTDYRITVVTQENKGLGGARNEGVKRAQGEYLFFLDGDDYIVDNALEILNETIKNNKYDVVVFDAYYINDTLPTKTKKAYMNMTGIFDGPIYKNDGCFKNLIQLAPASWNKVVRREFFIESEFSFPEKVKYEDVVITRQIFYEANKIYAIKQPLYFYIQREGSIMNSAPSEDMIVAYNHLIDYFSHLNIYSFCKDVLEAIAIKNIVHVYIEGSYEYTGRTADISIAVRNINTKYPNWRQNPYFSKREIKEFDLLLNRGYLAYIFRYKVPKAIKAFILSHTPAIFKKEKIKKIYRLLRDKEYKRLFFLIIGKINFLSKKCYFAGSYCSRLDIIKHKIAYFLCPQTNSKNDFPACFPFFKTKGKSKVSNEILVTPHTNNFDNGFLFVINADGKVIKYKKIDGFAYAFRKYQLPNGEKVFAYLQTEDRFNNAFDNTKLIILDDSLNNEIDCVAMLKNGRIPYDGYPCDNHEYKILDKGHYVLTCVKNDVVNNVPGFENSNVRIINSIIQEQNNGIVNFQFDFSEHPELFDASLFPDNYSAYMDGTDNYADCAHLNSIDIDPKNGDWLLSYRSIGLVKIDHKDGHIKWVMGRKRCDISGINEKNICLYQHDARYQSDGSITVFDNYGSPNGKCRICRYWIDEDSLTLVRYKEYETHIKKSEYMGSAQLVDMENEVFEIAYGSGFPFIAFEEYDFKHSKQNMKLIFEEGFDLYQVYSE